VWVAIGANVLHGICYAFFFATVYIFVDEFFPKDIRSSAQGLFNFLILGIGPLATNLASPYVTAMFSTSVTDAAGKVSQVINYQTLFQIPMWTAVGAAVLLALFFHPPAKNPDAEEAKPPTDG
jgi:MFS family permease